VLPGVIAQMPGLKRGATQQPRSVLGRDGGNHRVHETVLDAVGTGGVGTDRRDPNQHAVGDFSRQAVAYRGEPLLQAAVHHVVRFREKPNADLAESFLRNGNFRWNAGMFVWSVPSVLSEFNRHTPELASFISQVRGRDNFEKTVRDRFAKLPRISFDYAIMEKARTVETLLAQFDWDDVGLWTALSKHLPKDAAGNVIGAFALTAVKDLGFSMPLAGKAWQPLWPMLFVTIACGAISGWHALVGSIGPARQIEYDTDALPVGAGAMLFGEFPLALLSLTAVSIAGAGGGGGRFAAGVGKLVYAGTFGLIPETFGTALGFATFVIIVLTVTQLVFRVMRVTLAEWVGDAIPPMRNMHVSSFISMGFTAALVLTGTWVYLWQMFGASNQLMAALSLLVVSVWLKSEHRNPTYAVVPMVFMYFTTLAATAITARNLYVTIAANPKMSALPVGGAWAMIAVSVLLFAAAIIIGWDGYKAYLRHGTTTPKAPAVQPGIVPPAAHA
jgi:hypothetical protein